MGTLIMWMTLGGPEVDVGGRGAHSNTWNNVLDFIIEHSDCEYSAWPVRNLLSGLLCSDYCSFYSSAVYTYHSVPQIRPPFCNLCFSTKCKGAYTWDTTFSLAITPSLLVPHPPLCVQLEEDNAFDDLQLVSYALRRLLDIHASMKHVWSPPLTEVQRYGTAMQSKYTME